MWLKWLKNKAREYDQTRYADYDMILLLFIHDRRVGYPRMTNKMSCVLTSVTVLLLERLDESDVLLLGVGGRDTLVDQLLPCVSLGLALLWKTHVSGVFDAKKQKLLSRECRCYLEIEHAGLVRRLDGRVLGTLLEESVELSSRQSM